MREHCYWDWDITIQYKKPWKTFDEYLFILLLFDLFRLFGLFLCNWNFCCWHWRLRLNVCYYKKWNDNDDSNPQSEIHQIELFSKCLIFSLEKYQKGSNTDEWKDWHNLSNVYKEESVTEHLISIFPYFTFFIFLRNFWIWVNFVFNRFILHKLINLEKNNYEHTEKANCRIFKVHDSKIWT